MFFTVHFASKSVSTVILVLELGETAVTVQLKAAWVAVGVLVQGIKARVGVSLGAGVFDGAGVFVGAGVSVGAEVLVGVTGVAEGAVRVRFATTVCTACVDTASNVGLGSMVGTATVGAAPAQPARTDTRTSPVRMIHAIFLQNISFLLVFIVIKPGGRLGSSYYKTV